MSYWNEVRDIVYKGINMAVDNLKEGANTAAEKSKQGVTYVQLKKDLFFEQRTLQAFLADLGDITHNIYKENKINCYSKWNKSKFKNKTINQK